MTNERPGRSCPLHYRYAPSVFDRGAEISADTLYVIGGLYGNPLALARIFEIAAEEKVKPTLVFNGDFNWFNVDDASFCEINRAVLEHHALRGNVETELDNNDDGAGCGCAYPENVSDAEVENSNRIMADLQRTAARFPDITLRLTALPMHLVAEVGGVKIGVVHGDAHSLAGWDFSREALAAPTSAQAMQRDFINANVSIFACTHTCLPVIKPLPFAGKVGLIVNNGSAGMANVGNSTHGLITRISRFQFEASRAEQFSQASTRCGDLYIDLLRIDFDLAAWTRNFLSNWPAGSAAHSSYFKRITSGPAFNSDIFVD